MKDDTQIETQEEMGVPEKNISEKPDSSHLEKETVLMQEVRFFARSSNGSILGRKMAIRGHFFWGEYFGYILKRVWIGERKYFGG